MSLDEFFERIRRRIREMFEEMEEELASTRTMWSPDGVLEPLVSFNAYPDRYELVVDLPYGDLNALSIEVRDNLLTLKCQLKREIKFEKWGVFREIKFRRYETCIRLPPDADPSDLRVERDENRNIIRIIIPRVRR